MSQPATQTQSETHSLPIQTQDENVEESRRIRHLQLLMQVVTQVIQHSTLPVEQASQLVVDARRSALTLFPDKALAFDLIYWPRLQRAMRARYRMQ